MKKVKVGIIGCGYIGGKRAASARTNMFSDVEIVADIDLNRARELADLAGCEYTDDWREVVSSPTIDAVVVATTNDFLAPIALAALEGGMNVLSEKPMARNLAEAAPLVEAAELRNVALKVGFSLRHHPAIAKAHELFCKNQVGKLIFLRCRYGHGGRPGYESEWRSRKEISGGGELLDQGIHVVDLFNWFLGDFSEVVGFNLTGFWQAKDIEDNTFALLRTADNRVASVHVSCTQWKNLFSFEIFGDKGHMVVEGLGGSYGSEKLIIRDGAGNGITPVATEINFENGDLCWDLEWRDFISSVIEKREPIGSGRDAYRALQIVQAIYDSNMNHEVVPISPAYFDKAEAV